MADSPGCCATVDLTDRRTVRPEERMLQRFQLALPGTASGMRFADVARSASHSVEAFTAPAPASSTNQCPGHQIAACESHDDGRRPQDRPNDGQNQGCNHDEPDRGQARQRLLNNLAAASSALRHPPTPKLGALAGSAKTSSRWTDSWPIGTVRAHSRRKTAEAACSRIKQVFPDRIP
jgi:hypothetical protein